MFNQVEREDDAGNTWFDYALDGKVWGGLTVAGGRVETLPGGMERADVTHKLTIRPGACRLRTSTYFTYAGQRYDVLYWQPHYKRRDRLEVMLRMVVEDG